VSYNLRQAVLNAVDLVNTHAGQTSVHLHFTGDNSGLDFIANSASMHGSQFEFQAGYEKIGGEVKELSNIKTEIIQH